MALTDRDDPEKLFTVGQVAEMFSVKPDTVREWIKTGSLKGVKINSYWRIARSEIIRFGKSRY